MCMYGLPLYDESNLSLINRGKSLLAFVRLHQEKNGKEAREETEGKSDRVHRG